MKSAAPVEPGLHSQAAGAEKAGTAGRQPFALRLAGCFSPMSFIRLALLLALMFGLAHLAGLREFTTMLNGTMANVEVGWRMSVFLGTVYILAYLGFVLLVPTLLLAAVFLKIAERVWFRGRSDAQSSPS
ncbi:MAG TPA: hypothetical protein VN794_23315 [Methylomirabilota bacterium]|nr:hypothetical protein [Methylomirabilota bacterium]